jgi:FkbM family methyltransferase
MSFISYAQNNEDVILYRALREVKKGVYVDVGAQDPVIDSVTKAFYERGWQGVNIEPNEEYFRKLQDDRPHDVNLLTACGREEGFVSFYQVEHTGLSTTNAVYARAHAEAGHEVHPRDVACTTLDRICADCGIETIHFLKIDVEGSEREVLEGFSFEKVRPWIVVVEATEPNTTRDVSAEWEHLLIEHRYQFAYFDGLNRFYVAAEHADLVERFSSPPNPFDDYVSYHLWWARESLRNTQAAERHALVSSLNHALAEVQSLRNHIAERDTQLENMRSAIVEHGHRLEEQVRQLEDTRNTLAVRDRQVQEQVRQLEDARSTLAARDGESTAFREDQDRQRRTLLAQVHDLSARLAAAEHQLQFVSSSLSWRLTSPLRKFRLAMARIVHLVGQPFANQNRTRDQRPLNPKEPSHGPSRRQDA